MTRIYPTMTGPSPGTRTTSGENGRKEAPVARTFATRIDLPAGSREKCIALLNDRLADCVDLASQAKHAHWNVKGPDFIAMHKMFDELTDDFREMADVIAERAVALGGVAPGTVRDAAQRTFLPEYPSEAVTCTDHARAVADALAAFAKNVRRAIDQSEEFQDKSTADVFTEASRLADKWLWFVEAHLQAER